MNLFNRRHREEERRLNEELSGQESVLKGARAAASPESREVSSKMLMVEMDPSNKLSERRKAARDILAAFVRITDSADTDGKLRPGFMMMVDSENPTTIGLGSFTVGLEDLEIAMMRTQLRLIVLKHGVTMVRVEELDAGHFKQAEDPEKPHGSRHVIG